MINWGRSISEDWGSCSAQNWQDGIKIQAVNTSLIASIQYRAGIIKWQKRKLTKMDTKTRKCWQETKSSTIRETPIGLTCPEEKAGVIRLVARTISKYMKNLGWHMKELAEPLLKQTKKAGVIKAETWVIKESLNQEINKKIDKRIQVQYGRCSLQ